MIFKQTQPSYWIEVIMDKINKIIGRIKEKLDKKPTKKDLVLGAITTVALIIIGMYFILVRLNNP